MQLSRQHLQILLGMTLIWGMNWPVMKYAVSHYPPLSFRFFCMVLGIFAICGVAKAMNVSLKVPREHLPAIALLTLPNMIGWHLFCILGVSELSSGRSAILGYTMPVWAVLAGLIWGNKVPARGWFGLVCSMVAMALLLSAELQSLTGSPKGVALMATAAACWGLGTAMIRRYNLPIHAITFTHAMLLPTAVVMGLAAFFIEGTAHGLPDGLSQWWPIFYNAFGVFAFCQVGWFFLAKSLPPIASSLSVMVIPVVGVMSGAFFLGETPHVNDYIALGLILLSMAVVFIKRPTR